MNEIDDELASLKSNLAQINHSYSEIDNTLKFKWKEIRKLDNLEQDLNKLKLLSELPNQFKNAIAEFEEGKVGVEVFREPIKIFGDYNDVLTHYKKTVFFNLTIQNFMINLYSEIKTYIVRIKIILSK